MKTPILKRKIYSWLDCTSSIVPQETHDFTIAKRCWSIDFTYFIKIRCPNYFLHIFYFSHVDPDPLPVHFKPCSFLVLEVNCSTWKYLSYYEWSGPLWLEILGNNKSLVLNESNRHPHNKFTLFNLLIMILFHFLFVQSWTFIWF